MKDERPLYKVQCPYCGKVMYVCKSIGYESGMLAFGGGTCLECKTRLNFKFDNLTNEMIATDWKEWREKLDNQSVK